MDSVALSPLHRARPEQRQTRSATTVPALAINDISLSLAAAIPHITIPRLPLPNNKTAKSKGKIRRPSTASSAEERSVRLPSSSSGSDHLSPMSTPGVSYSDGLYQPEPSLSGPTERVSLEEMNRRAHAAVVNLRAEASRLSGAGEPTLISLSAHILTAFST